MLLDIALVTQTLTSLIDKHVTSSPDEPPIRFTPMGINLYYLLTGHSDLVGNTGVETEQTMVGLAMKALHDYPVVDDTTAIGGVKVFPVALQGSDNRFRISLQPV